MHALNEDDGNINHLIKSYPAKLGSMFWILRYVRVHVADNKLHFHCLDKPEDLILAYACMLL